MNLYDACLRLQELATSYWSRRAAAELQYAVNVSRAKGGVYDTLVRETLDFLLSAAKEKGAVTKAAVLAAEERLAPMTADAKAFKVRCVGHAHIDMNWMWGLQETAAVTVDTFRTMLQLMREYPAFTFAQSQASTYEIIERYAPELLPEIRQRIREGRWEVSASTWVEADKNMPNGESMARHILYTKNYLSKLLDVSIDDLTLDFEPDTFGHSAALPEILAAGGVRYYYHCRGSADVPVFTRWQAKSGRSVLVYREPHWYNFGIKPDVFCEVPLFCRDNGVDVMLKVYGVGDHGGGPTRRDIECLLDLMTWPMYPTVTFGTYRGFFEEIEVYADRFPVFEGERNFLLTGCYTTQSRIKMANRIGEDRLYEAEALSAAAKLFGGADDAAQFADAWKKVLFNQFHDILPGSGTVETREHALGRFQESMAVAAVRGGAAMQTLAAAIDTSGIVTEEDRESISEGAGVGYHTDAAARFGLPQSERGTGKTRIFHLFNTTQYDFDGVTEITVWDWQYDKSRAVFRAANGSETACRLLSDGRYYWDHYGSKFAVRVQVPAFGYATYTLTEREAAPPVYVGIASVRQDTYGDMPITLENGCVTAIICRRTGQLLSLTDKRSGKQMIKAPAASLLWITENTVEGMTSWRVGTQMKVENLNETRNVQVTEIRLGGVRQWVRYTVSAGERTSVEVCVSLDEGSERLVFDVTADFHDVGSPAGIPQLRFAVPHAYVAAVYRSDIPCGVIDRTALAHDIPATSFSAAIPQEGGACLYLVSDTKYGFRGDGGSLSLNLIRAAYDPDPTPEYGVHRIRIGVGAAQSGTARELTAGAAHFAHPLGTVSVRPNEGGTLPLCGQLLEVSGNVRVSTIKPAEDGDGILCRLYDLGEGGAFTLRCALPLRSAEQTDVCERSVKAWPVADNAVSGTLQAGELLTLRLRM